MIEDTFNKDLTVNKMGFEQFVKYYLFDIVLPSKSIKDKTFTVYEGFYRKYIKNSSISNIKLIELKKEHLQRYFNQLSNNSSLSISTIKHIKTFISTVINYAVNEDYIVKNYCSSVKLATPTSTNTPTNKALTDEEINKLINTCKDEELLIIIKLALSTGMRINELLAITENDIDFKECSIKVNKTIASSKHYKNENSYVHKSIITTPKSKSSNRIAYFNPILKDELKSYINTVIRKYFKNSTKYTKDSLLFTNQKVNIIYSSNYNKKLNKLFKECNIDKSGFHVFRHTCGSKLYENNVNIKIISQQLGHSNINITSNVYVHLEEDTRKNAIRNLDKYFNG